MMRSSHRKETSFLIEFTALIAFLCLSVNGQQPVIRSSEDRDTGIQLFRQNRFHEAVETLRKAVQKNREDYEAWLFLGLALIQEKELKEATKSLEAVVKLQPGFAAGHGGLAYVLLLRNKLSEAVKQAQAALSIDSKMPDAHYVIGVARLRTGAIEDAAKEADIIINLKPDFGPAYLLKSEALVNSTSDAQVENANRSDAFRKQRYQEAKVALEKYLELTPGAPNKQVRLEQLESLRFYVASHTKGDPEELLSGKEVTAKPKVISKPEPTYTETAKLHQITGTVTLRCVFAADGKMKHLMIVKGLPDGLTEVAIAAARKIKFVPATKDGRPVSIWMELQYNFNLY